LRSSGVLHASGVERLLERQPIVQRTIDLRNPYVDPMNAIQVELLRRHRAGDEAARLPLLRSIAGIAAALRTPARGRRRWSVGVNVLMSAAWEKPRTYPYPVAAIGLTIRGCAS